MAKRKTKTAGKRAKAKKTGHAAVVQHALEVTWVLNGQLKRARLQHLYIGELLVTVRDENLFGELGHPDLADYAWVRLNLGIASLYRYVQVYDWVKESHPGWLKKKAKGFIPDFSDISDLMWIEKELKRKDLSDEDRKELEALQKKGLAGKLRQKDLREWRHKDDQAGTINDYLKKFNSFRASCAKLEGLPPEVITCLDDAIAILKNHQTVAKCGFDMSDLRDVSRVV